MYRLIFVMAMIVTACGDNAAAPRDAPDGTPIDAGIDGPRATGACLDRPDEIARAPSGSLPCELLPPGFSP
jgi:hypothetical protein